MWKKRVFLACCFENFTKSMWKKRVFLACLFENFTKSMWKKRVFLACRFENFTKSMWKKRVFLACWFENLTKSIFFWTGKNGQRFSCSSSPSGKFGLWGGLLVKNFWEGGCRTEKWATGFDKNCSCRKKSRKTGWKWVQLHQLQHNFVDAV